MPNEIAILRAKMSANSCILYAAGDEETHNIIIFENLKHLRRENREVNIFKVSEDFTVSLRFRFMMLFLHI